MSRTLLVTASLLFTAGALAADLAPATATMARVDTKPSAAAASQDATKGKEGKTEAGAKALSGMSILGNQEAPKALVIVPWKSSQLGDAQGLSRALDDGRRPVDKEVFMRELAYYEIRSN
jgi:hypothetical protein